MMVTKIIIWQFVSRDYYIKMAAPMTSIVSRHVRRFFVPNKANKVLLPATFFSKICITSGTDTENNTGASKDSTKRIDKDDLRENAFEAGATEDLVHASHADANKKIGDIDGRGLQRQSGSTDQSGLEKAFAMFDRLGSVSGEDKSKRENIPDQPFASLLRNSKLMQIGDPEGRIVVGTIIETIEDDLYIDYGGKFHCVVKRPRTRQQWVKLFVFQCSSLTTDTSL